MKTVLLLLIIFTTTAKAQITLEHTYNTSSQNIGERYSFAFYTDAGLNHFTYEESTNTIRIYNETHLLIKTFVVPIPTGFTFYADGIASGGLLATDKLFNSDSSIEMLIPLYKTGSGPSEYKFILVNDSGNLIQEFNNVNKCGGIYKTSTNVYKLILKKDQYPTSEVYVYSLPGVLSANQQQAMSSMLRAYPNPVESTFRIQRDLNNTEIKVEVFDTTGKLVLTTSREIGNEIEVDISNLNDGVYIYKVGKQSGKIIKR